MYLGQLGQGRADKEWLRYKAEVADNLIQLARMRATRERADRRLAVAQDVLGALRPPTGEELSARLNGEERATESVVADRRMREFAARRQDAEAEVRQSRAEVAKHDAEIARLGEPVRIRFQVAQARAELIEAYVRRRCESYLARLVRRHFDATRIVPLIRSDWPERPPWTTWALSPDLSDPRAGPPVG